MASSIEMRFDPASQRNYYVDLATGRTGWTPAELGAGAGHTAVPPSASPAPYAQHAAAAGQADVEERFDASANRPYYYNRTARKSSWSMRGAAALSGGGATAIAVPWAAGLWTTSHGRALVDRM